MNDVDFLAFPRHVQLQTHTACNMACTLCPHPVLGLNSRRDRLSWLDFTRVVDECCEHDEFTELILDLQNEPLIDVDLAKRIRHVKGRKPTTFVGITTNGRRLSSDVSRNLLDAGIDEIVVSLNAARASTFAVVERRTPFADIIRNVNNLLAVVDAPERVMLSFGVCNTNRDDVKPFIERMELLGIPYRIFPLHDRIGSVSSDTFLKLEPAPICHLPLFSMAVRADGSVLLCCQDWNGSRVMGNVLTDGVSAVWQSAEYRNLRERLIYASELPANPCSGCQGRVVYSADRVLPREVAHMNLRMTTNAAVERTVEETNGMRRFRVLLDGDGHRVHDFVTRRDTSVGYDVAWTVERLQAGTANSMLAQAFASEHGCTEGVARKRVDAAFTHWVIAQLLDPTPLVRDDILELPKPVEVRIDDAIFSAALVTFDAGTGDVILEFDSSAPAPGTAVTVFAPCVLATVTVVLDGIVRETEARTVTCSCAPSAIAVLESAMKGEVAGNPLAAVIFDA